MVTERPREAQRERERERREQQASRAPRARRRWAIAALATAAALAAIVVAGLPLYVFPPAADVSRADVIFVIGPPTEPRMVQAERLREAGVADRILVSVPTEGPSSAAEFDACPLSYVECASPDPFTTKGEALLLQEYAAQHGIQDAVVITFTPHVARTRYIFDRCFPGDTSVVAVEPDRPFAQWAYQYAYQSAAFVKAWITPCADPGSR